MTVEPSALHHALAETLGPKGYTRDMGEIEPWLTDWRGVYHGRAAAMLSPANTEEVAAIVKLAGATQTRITIQGGNSGMVAGATPDNSGDALLLSLRRMNRIRGLDAPARTMTAEAGVILANAHDAAADTGLRFPLTLGGKGSATIGGLISTNAGGTQVLRHGSMRGLTLGLEVVLPDGQILDLLSPLMKDNRGPDLKQLFIGAEGTLGIVTAATLKLSPAIAQRAVAWVAIPSPDSALALLRRWEPLLGSALEGFEIIPEATLAKVLRHIPQTQRPVASPTPWHLLIECVAHAGDADPAALLESALSHAIEQGDIADATIAANEAQGEAFWRLRDSISEAERTEGPALQHDISVPVALMPEAMRQIETEVTRRWPGTEVISFGHLGDGNVHCHVRPPRDGDAASWIAEHGQSASACVYAITTALGGSISAEHGIGRVKRALLGEGDPARVAALRALKAAFDPAGILNPGVLIP